MMSHPDLKHPAPQLLTHTLGYTTPGTETDRRGGKAGFTIGGIFLSTHMLLAGLSITVPCLTNTSITITGVGTRPRLGRSYHCTPRHRDWFRNGHLTHSEPIRIFPETFL